MSEKILSQDEVDALLRGVVSGDVETASQEEAAATGGTHGYSLLNQERIIRGRMPTLEMINDRFIRKQTISWGAALRCEVEFSIVSTQVTKFGEILKKLPLPSSMNVFRMEPLRGNGLLVLDAMLVYIIVDHFFGGSGQTHVKPEGRDFTLIQQRVIKNIVTKAFEELALAWQSVLAVTIEHLRSECNPQFAMVVSTSEIVMVTTLQVAIGDTTRDLFLIYPYSMLEPIKEKLYSGLVSDHQESDTGWGKRFADALQVCPVTLTVELGTARVCLQEVLNFAPGDVIVLDQRPHDTISCMVEGHQKFEGNAGVLRGNQAFRLSKVLE